ncbi:hypothetical protein EDD64_110129, partial [Effusibacillus lacus]
MLHFDADSINRFCKGVNVPTESLHEFLCCFSFFKSQDLRLATSHLNIRINHIPSYRGAYRCIREEIKTYRLNDFTFQLMFTAKLFDGKIPKLRHIGCRPNLIYITDNSLI